MQIVIVDADRLASTENDGRYRPLAGTENDWRPPACGRHYQM